MQGYTGPYRSQGKEAAKPCQNAEQRINDEIAEKEGLLKDIECVKKSQCEMKP